MPYQPVIIKKMHLYKKTLASFFLLIILNQLFTPTIALALTAGPTAPEATNFEPIDTTDMVNPLTGNFTYSLPLLEVPGPEGNYPLALAYHAGVQPNEEASWVGLGWSLNPGAITRSVNGYADDFSGVLQGQRDYWSGGNRSTFGINFGLPAGVMFGLSFSQDTYQGFGVGLSSGLGFNLIGPIGIGVTSGVDAYGNAYAGADVSISTGKSGQEGFKLGGSIGVTTNFEKSSVGANAGVSYGTQFSQNISLLGASISSSPGNSGLTIGGGSSNVYNANAGKIQTTSSGWAFTAPLPGGFSIGISKEYTRYWSDETTQVNTYGSLYAPTSLVGGQSILDQRAYDNYRLDDLESSYNSIPDNLKGGTFPDFDNYNVTAQGLSGSMRPYIFQSALFKQNQTLPLAGSTITNTSIDDLNVGNLYQTFANSIQFRFINDFSNAYRQGSAKVINATNLSFDTPISGNNDGTTGINSSAGQLAGSKHIAWYTNDAINTGAAKAAGFIDTKSAGFIRMGNTGALTNSNGLKQIGGFVITNSSGVSYHYALPVYEYNEYTKTTSKDGSTYTAETRNEPYAYTWYLTAITGPDFYDTNNDGLADDGDWGYWVTFDYGKWEDSYQWRNPAQGTHVEVDPNYNSYSQGTKEIYYLDAIKTRTHTALFVKELRADAKSLGSNGFDYYTFNSGSSISNGEPKASLRLNNILLIPNNVLNSSLTAIRSASTTYNYADWVRVSRDNPSTLVPTTTQYGTSVIDVNDIAQLSENLNNECLRKIQFNYDYSLCPGVPNSYDATGAMYATSPASAPSDPTKLGKLTLLSVDFQGKGATMTTPPVKFQYDLDASDPSNQDQISVTQSTANTTGTNQTGTIQVQTLNKFKIGDILSFQVNANKYYCTLLTQTSPGQFNVLFLNNSPGGAFSNLAATRTKNPPYNKDAYDIWGSYKSDYIPITGNDNLSRLTSPLSNGNADVWSLKKVKTGIGAEFSINYEGDTYHQSVVTKSRSLILNSVTIDPTLTTMSLQVANPTGIDLSTIYHVGNKIDGILLLKRKLNFTDGSGSISDVPYLSLGAYPNSTISSINGNSITLTIDSKLKAALGDPNLNTSPPNQVASTNVAELSVLAGNLKSNNLTYSYGGGIRVRDLIIDNLNGQIKKTSYSYNLPDPSDPSTHPRVSSGVTSYEPVSVDIDNLDNIAGITAFTKTNYRNFLYSDINYLLPIAREVPAPGVMYEYVTVADSSILSNGNRIPIEGQTMYQYRTFNLGMIGVHPNSVAGQSFANVVPKSLTIKNYTSQVGNVVRVIHYDVKGNKLSEVQNHYLNDNMVDNSFEYQVANYDPILNQYNYQGLVEERYTEARRTSNSVSPNNYAWQMMLSGRDEIPIIQTGTTQIDYKNNNQINTQNLAYDFYSGEITKTLTTDSYGNRFITQITPAYREYPAMGLKVNTPTNANMLVQQASNYTFIVDASNAPIGVVTAHVQTWGNDIGVSDEKGAPTTIGQSAIWRMKGTYSWMPQGTSVNNLQPYSSFVDYFVGNGSANNNWKQTGLITQYNVFSAALEASDINGNYASTHMGYNNSKVIITATAAKYNEIAYAGAEDILLSSGNFSSNVSPGGGTVLSDSTLAHTGIKSLSVPPNQNGFTYSVALSQIPSLRGNYSVAVWVKPTASNQGQATLFYQVNGGAIVTPVQSFAKSAGGWYLLEMTVPASALTASSGNLVVGCTNGSSSTLYFDDFKFQPTSSPAVAYVYDTKTGELDYTLGSNNLFVRYQYDNIGRLVRTYKEVLGKAKAPLISAVNYNYGKFNQ